MRLLKAFAGFFWGAFVGAWLLFAVTIFAVKCCWTNDTWPGDPMEMLRALR